MWFISSHSRHINILILIHVLHIYLIYPSEKMDKECQFVSHPFKSRKYVKKDEFGNCVLGLPKPVPLEIVNAGEGCGAHPSLSVKVVAMKEGEEGYDSNNLQVYFSEDHGDTFYNEGNAHVATPRPNRMLLSKKGSDDEDEDLVEEDRELLALHAETQRKLCYNPSDNYCWNVYGTNEWCYTTSIYKRPEGPWCLGMYCETQLGVWVCKSRNDCTYDDGVNAPICSQTVDITGDDRTNVWCIP